MPIPCVRDSVTRACTDSRARKPLQLHNKSSTLRVRELLLCDILITRAGDGRWPRYQAKSLACPGYGKSLSGDVPHAVQQNLSIGWPGKMFISLQAGQNFPQQGRFPSSVGWFPLCISLFFSLQITKIPGKEFPIFPVFSKPACWYIYQWPNAM